MTVTDIQANYNPETNQLSFYLYHNKRLILEQHMDVDMALNLKATGIRDELGRTLERAIELLDKKQVDTSAHEQQG